MGNFDISIKNIGNLKKKSHDVQNHGGWNAATGDILTDSVLNVLLKILLLMMPIRSMNN